ncbi:ammonium transporter [Faunimonas sp. B44]|uniref:ammonium transporter n=1 Tax=Faunimonas sp. B44 TaxID=3461493 RepID=UPI0040449171
MKLETLARWALPALAIAALLAEPSLAQEMAQEAAPAVEAPAAEAAADPYPFILNTLLFLIGGFLVMWMAAGFAMLEAGMVRSKNVSMQCLKNISLYSIAGLLYWVVGYNLMYEGVDGGFIGTFGPKVFPDPATETGDYSAASDWFFQMVFCATAASIVSGTVAERIKLWPFLAFVVVLTGFIYPIAGSWKWGAGWLDEMGFADFAGSTLVHSVGGWAALTGAIIIGARKGKFGPGGQVMPLPGSSMPLATLGTFILWLGWFGFNGASQLAMGTISDAASVATIFANTNLAAAAGVVAALVLTQLMYGKVDLTMALNGALAGLVSITAEPLTPSPAWAIIIGAVGGVIVVFVVPLLDKLRIDDVVGAIPVHLVAGIWGTLAVPLTNAEASFGTQIVGIAAYGAFTVAVSAVIWLALKATVGLRPSEETELLGLDRAEVGVEAYPEFGAGTVRA